MIPGPRNAVLTTKIMRPSYPYLRIIGWIRGPLVVQCWALSLGINVYTNNSLLSPSPIVTLIPRSRCSFWCINRFPQLWNSRWRHLPHPIQNIPVIYGLKVQFSVHENTGMFLKYRQKTTIYADSHWSRVNIVVRAYQIKYKQYIKFHR